jgi:hypothetical protein
MQSLSLNSCVATSYSPSGDIVMPAAAKEARTASWLANIINVVAAVVIVIDGLILPCLLSNLAPKSPSLPQCLLTFEALMLSLISLSGGYLHDNGSIANPFNATVPITLHSLE